MWRHLRHPNILPLLGANLEGHQLALFSEWMDHGNINEFVEGHKGINRVQLVSDEIPSCGNRFSQSIQLVDAANGLGYMHGLDMVHGDLKGVRFYCQPNIRPLNNTQANILINKSFRACLADFGLATIAGAERGAAANASSTSVASEVSLMSFTTGGTTRWMSPELLDPDQFGITDSRPTKQSDCYALGMVVYEVRWGCDLSHPHNGLTYMRQVLCGHAPYSDIMNGGAVIKAIMDGRRPQKPEAAATLGFTDELWGIIRRCWSADADARPDVRTVLSHLDHATWSWETRQLVPV